MPVSNLSPWQQFLSQKFPGKNAQFNNDQLMAAADEFFGKIPIPEGSQILFQNGGYAKYIDPDGYTHEIRRQLDGRDPSAGQVQENTDRPAVLPAEKTQGPIVSDLMSGVQGLGGAQIDNLLKLAQGQTPESLDPGISGQLDAINALATQLQQNPQLLQLDPETQAALDAITARDQAALKEQFDQEQGSAIAKLYGNRVNQSSIANTAIGQLLQKQGLVTAQSQADAATRDLQTRQFLAQQQQQQRQLALQGLLGATSAQLEGFGAKNQAAQAQQNSLLDLLKALTGQQTERDISSANVGLGYKDLAERARQANLNFELGQQKADLELANSRNTLNKIIGAVSAAGQLAGGIGSLTGALGSFAQPKTLGPTA